LARKLIITKVSQETLVEMIGTTRSQVSFSMNKFRKVGFISYNGTSKLLVERGSERSAAHHSQDRRARGVPPAGAGHSERGSSQCGFACFGTLRINGATL
jgi:hypothetical protein